MDIDQLPTPPDLVPVFRGETTTVSEGFGRLYKDLHAEMLGVFPADSDAWRIPGGRAEIPTADPAVFAELYANSDPFSRQHSDESFAQAADFQKHGWLANGLELREYQRGQSIWGTSSIVTGTRHQSARLIRGAFGAGKTILAGIENKAFRNGQYRALKNGAKPEDLPVGAFAAMRKEHAMQNAVGSGQAIAMNPPYTIEKTHINQFYRDMSKRYGKLFTEHFATKEWNALFTEEYGDAVETMRVVSGIIAKQGQGALKTFNEQSQSEELLNAVVGILMGRLIFIPGPDGTPQPKVPPLRIGDMEDTRSYQGDAMYDTPVHEVYPVRASHKDLLPDRSAYGALDEPELFFVMTGNILTTTSASVRERYHETLKRIRFLGLDEGGKLSPEQILHPLKEHGAKQALLLYALTAHDTGRPGWLRSPEVPATRSIELGVSPKMGFQVIAPKDGKLVAPDTEEGWNQWLEAHTADVPLAKELGLRQPRDCNSIILLPTTAVAREFALRYQKFCDERGIPHDVCCYDGKLGNSKHAVQQWFNGPGDGKKIFSVAGQISHGFSLPKLENVEVCANVSPSDVRQAMGRLFHNRSLLAGTRTEAEPRRTYFRQHLLHGAHVPLLEAIAEEYGIDLKRGDELKWMPLHVLLDQKGFNADERRDATKRVRGKKGGEPVLPSFPAAKRGDKKPGTPLKFTNILVMPADERARALRPMDFVPDVQGLVPESTILQWIRSCGLTTSYLASVRMAVLDAYRDKKRGRDLAVAAYAKIDSLLERGGRMAAGSNGNGMNTTTAHTS